MYGPRRRQSRDWGGEGASLFSRTEAGLLSGTARHFSKHTAKPACHMTDGGTAFYRLQRKKRGGRGG